MVTSKAPAWFVTALCSPTSAGLRAVISAPATGAWLVASTTAPETIPPGCAAARAERRTAAAQSARAAARRQDSIQRFPTGSCCRTGSVAIKKMSWQERLQGGGLYVLHDGGRIRGLLVRGGSKWARREGIS